MILLQYFNWFQKFNHDLNFNRINLPQFRNNVTNTISALKMLKLQQLVCEFFVFTLFTLSIRAMEVE